MSVKLPNLIPPFRFTIVEENLFRGGYPKPRNKRFLKRLKLKTVLSLIPDKLLPEMQEFFEQQNIQLLQLNVDKMKEDNIPLTYNKTIMALQLLIDPANHPLYIHCLDGADVTGLVIACLRKIQMWNNTSAMSEFARHLHTNVISSEEFEFIENFRNFEITIPMHLPTWLWGGQVNFRKHPSLRLKFLNSDMMTEEERELKELKEKKEKEKEDYYKRRKNDLLDNLFDPNAPGSRHRAASSSNNNNNSNNNSSNNNSINNSSNNSNSTSNNNNSNNNNNNNANINNIPSIQSTLNTVNGTNPSSLVDTDMSIPLAENAKQSVEDAKDPYLVDVDVDVDGVMMDGLDQVEYMNRGGGNTLNGRFYAEDDERGMLMDEDGDLYNDQGSRYISEPISRTLEALALEGLTEF